MVNLIVGRIWNDDERRVWIDGEQLLPEESQKVFNHSPDGFSWGYHGSGCAQLALAILLRFTNKATALKYYQQFKAMFVAQWDISSSFSTEIDVRYWLQWAQEQDKLLQERKDKEE